MVTCKARFTEAGELVYAVCTRGVVTTRIARTLVEVVLTILTCINTSITSNQLLLSSTSL